MYFIETVFKLLAVMFDVAYDVAPVNVCACVGHKKDGEEFN
jgi:hypothetical protein